jgi:hypothetical protein
MLPQFVVTWGQTAGSVGARESADDPADLVECTGGGRLAPGLALDVLLERSPAGQAVLAGDGQLGVVQGGELPCGQAALGLELEVAQVRLAGELAWLIGHRQSFLGARGPRDRAGKTGYAALGRTAGEFEALCADPAAAGNCQGPL